MDYIINGFKEALNIIFHLDREFIRIVLVSCKVSFMSTVLATTAGIPLALVLTFKKFPGSSFLISVSNTLMALPTVVVGLLVYSFISRRGPFGELNLLFTQTAIVIGQVILILPIITSLTVSTLKGLDKRIEKTAVSLGADPVRSFFMLLHEARHGLMAVVIAGFGRVFAEVGVSMMLGGNIKSYTRTITTAIALETSKGEFAMSLALGMVLLTIAFTVNGVFYKFRGNERK